MLRDFFERVRKANLSLKPSKCKIGFSQVDFLGHTLSGRNVDGGGDGVTGVTVAVGGTAEAAGAAELGGSRRTRQG